MTTDQVTGQIRHVLTAISGIFIAKGTIEPGHAETIVGFLLLVIGAGWSWIAKRKADKEPTTTEQP